MTTPQGTVSFGTISADDIRGATFTRSRGVAPDACILDVAAGDINQSVGTLSFSFDGTTRSWTGCAVDLAHLEVPEGTQLPPKQRVVIWDRRWKWKNSYINLNCNQRTANGAILSATQKTPAQIATLCATALGETITVSAMATGMYPRFNYSGRADLLLQELCRITAHEVVPVGDAFAVVPYGSGADLPSGGELVSSYTAVKSAYPDRIKVIGAPIMFQDKIRLEAVGRDTDGTIKLIDDLSYKPASGWEKSWYTHFADVTLSARALAFEDVFKLWRIKEQWAGGLTVTGASEVPTSISQYLPIQDFISAGSSTVSQPAYIEGVWWPRSELNTNTPTNSRYVAAFTVDKENGLIRTRTPVVKISSSDIAKADLGLIVQHPVVLAAGGFDVYSKTGSSLGGSGTQILLRPEMVYAKLNSPSSSSNLTALNTEADAYLTNHALKYADRTFKHMRYEGITSADPTGMVAQVRFSTGGGRICYSDVSRIYEMDLFTPHQAARERLTWVDATRGVS